MSFAYGSNQFNITDFTEDDAPHVKRDVKDPQDSDSSLKVHAIAIPDD